MQKDAKLQQKDGKEDIKAIQANVEATRADGGVSVLTRNVWFGDRHESPEAFKKRCDAILEYVK